MEVQHVITHNLNTRDVVVLRREVRHAMADVAMTWLITVAFVAPFKRIYCNYYRIR